MIVETSAMIAILRGEPEAAEFRALIEADPYPRMSVVNYVEAAVVIDAGKDAVGSRRLDDVIHRAGIEILPVTVVQGQLARQAYRDYGKGSGHPARLNFGDCFGYALAKERREPLLFKGNDFSATDVEKA